MLARNAFQATVPNYGRNQFGFNIRGPISKDKLFTPTSYELTSTDFYLDVNPTSGPWTAYKGSFLAPNKNHTSTAGSPRCAARRVTYDSMVSARYPSRPRQLRRQRLAERRHLAGVRDLHGPVAPAISLAERQLHERSQLPDGELESR